VHAAANVQLSSRLGLLNATNLTYTAYTRLVPTFPLWVSSALATIARIPNCN